MFARSRMIGTRVNVGRSVLWYSTDFDEYAAGEFPSDWDSYRNGHAEVYNEVADAGGADARVLRLARPIDTSTQGTYLRARPSGYDFDAPAEIRAAYHWRSTRCNRFGVWGAGEVGAPHPDSWRGWTAEVQFGFPSSLRLFHGLDGGLSYLVSTPFDVAAGDRVSIALNISTDTVRAKAWRTEEAEPTEWMLEAANVEGSTGHAGLNWSHNDQQSDASMDTLALTVGPA